MSPNPPEGQVALGTVWLPVELGRRVGRFKADQRMSLRAIVIAALTEWLDRHEQEEQQ